MLTTDEVAALISRELGFTPTEEQANAIRTFVSFMSDRSPYALMIMRGSAGTGKTSVTAAIMRFMRRWGRKVVALAPTGRAAKVLSLSAGQQAYTIHRRIYRQKKFGGTFSPAPNMTPNTLFVVDESSMIANYGQHDAIFGNGMLLDDLISHVYCGTNCRLLLIGDSAQLPPVGEERSPALDTSFMQGYGMKVYECSLNEVVRQRQASGILHNATAVRRLITANDTFTMPKILFKGFGDVVSVRGDELIDSIASSYSESGTDETMVVTRSNKRANIYNHGIRNAILGREEQLEGGDMIMIVKNNYYWTENGKSGGGKQEEASAGQEGGDDDGEPDFLANGDIAIVQRVRNVRQLYGLTFADLWLRLPDHDDRELKATAILDSLATEAPALTAEQSQRLYEGVLEDYADIPTKKERIEKLRSDPYFNALQIKFAYAVTCHKAQGGQWSHVYIDQGYMTEDMLSASYLHWLYTAITRATSRLFFVNWAEAQTDNGGAEA